MRIQCSCKRGVDLAPSSGEVRLTALDESIKGALLGRCKCGQMHIRLPELTPEQSAKVRALVEQGGRTGLSIGYNGADVVAAKPRPGRPKR